MGLYNFLNYYKHIMIWNFIDLSVSYWNVSLMRIGTLSILLTFITLCLEYWLAHGSYLLGIAELKNHKTTFDAKNI